MAQSYYRPHHRLEERYADSFLEKAREFRAEYSIKQVSDALLNVEGALFPVQEGGIFAALWNMSEGTGRGFDIELLKIPMRQETVEICEFFELNPYRLCADGMAVFVTPAPEAALKALKGAGIPCSLAGMLTSEKGKCLRRGLDIRYLDRPAQDEIYRFLSMCS